MKEAYLCRVHYAEYINYRLGLIILIVTSIPRSNHSHLAALSQQCTGHLVYLCFVIYFVT